MVGVAGFEPEMLSLKTLVTQGFFDFITFFRYIFAYLLLSCLPAWFAPVAARPDAPPTAAAVR